MLHTSHSVRACACAILITIVSNVASLHADTILDTNTFSSSQPSGGGFVVATTQNFSLTSAEIADTTFEANFDFIDAGIEILVNGISLFATGDDVSQFNGGNQTVFTQTGAVNLGIPFGPTGDGTPRLTVQSDSTGTQFLGPDLAANGAGNIINYQPGFNVANFTSLLQPGNNQIEIVNLNSFQGANLGGDFTVTLVAPTAVVPEPTSLSLCLMGAMFCVGRRRRR